MALPLLIRLWPGVEAEGWTARVVDARGAILYQGMGWPTEADALRAGEKARAAILDVAVRSELDQIRDHVAELGAEQERERAAHLSEVITLRRVARAAEGRATALAAELDAAYAVLGRASAAASADRGDETCTTADMDPATEARRGFGGLANSRDRIIRACLIVIHDHQEEWARLTPGMDPATWTAAVQMRDAYVADLIRAIGDAL